MAALLLQVLSWSQLLLIAQGVVFAVLLVVAVYYSIRMGSVKAWKDRAQERKETIEDRDAEIVTLEKRLQRLTTEYEVLERRSKDVEVRINEASQFNFELQGKLRLYERKYGPIETKDSDN